MGKVTEGRDGSTSDIAKADSRPLEERGGRLDALRAALVEGEASGPARPFDFDAFIAAKCKPRRR